MSDQFIETPQAAAHRLTNNAIYQRFKPEALHEYTDQAGNALHWRVRLKNPETGEKFIRPMKLDREIGYVIGEPEYPDGKPLYNLQNLISQPDDPVIICEGEWCVDKLKELGILAVTSGSADSTTRADWKPLANRSIVIWPDNDEAGKRFADTAITELRKLDCSIRQVKVEDLNLPLKGDVVDWLAINPYATKADILSIPTFDAQEALLCNNSNEQIEDDKIEEEKSHKQNQVSVLVDFVVTRAELFHDKNAVVYAQDLTTRETRRLDGRTFKDWLVANFYESTGKSPREQSMREALNTLSGLARHKGQCHDVYVRVAKDSKNNDVYFLDLGEPGQSRAIRIAAGNWEIITDPPVRFLRPETLRPLPTPIAHNDLSLLWKMVNIPENDRLLVITWLIECLRPDTPFPILELIGEQGSAKSTTQTMLRRLIDPNACDLRAAPKTAEDIFVSAGVNWLVSYENISHLSPQIQDALCVLATGGGYAKRKLYSDADESVITVKRPIALNGISATVTAQDLLDRTISIETPLIDERVETTELWRAYEAELPNFLGALLTIFSQALACLPTIRLAAANRPRLVEFARLGVAIAETQGKTAEEFLTQFNASRQESIARTIDASPVASALIEWFESRGKCTTILPVKHLFEEIENKKPNNTDTWPRSAKGFADALRRVAPALRQMGIGCRSLGKTGSYISWEIKAL
jgi:5S rRNA maturation endonuclease (ribonuclease M5)